MTVSLEAFITAQTKLQVLPFLPELQLHLAAQADPVWRAVAELQQEEDPPFPFWAFAWAGGMGLSRYILDHPEMVRGKRVLDFAAGSGLGAIAAMKAGAKKVSAADCDPLAVCATQMNAQANNVDVTCLGAMNLEKPPKGFDVMIVGDVCYEQPMGFRIMRWLRLCAESGLAVLMADPGRAYVPEEGLERLASLIVPTLRELEDKEEREVTIWRVV